MGLFLEIILLLITGALLIISGIYTVQAAAKIYDLKSFETADNRKVEDQDLDLAHKYLTIASVLAWVGVAAAIGAIVLIFSEGGGSSFLLGLVLAVIILLIVVIAGLDIAAIAAVNKSFQISKVEKSFAYQHMIVAPIIAGTGLLLIIGVFIFLGVQKKRQEKKIKNEEFEAEKLIAYKRAELSE